MEIRIRNGRREWRCDLCHRWFGLDEEWTKKGAIEEFEEIWGFKPEEDDSAVCDDCWEKIHPSKFPDLYEQAKKIVEGEKSGGAVKLLKKKNG